MLRDTPLWRVGNSEVSDDPDEVCLSPRMSKDESDRGGRGRSAQNEDSNPLTLDGDECPRGGHALQSSHFSGLDAPDGKTIRETRSRWAIQNASRAPIPDDDDGDQ